MSDLPSDPKIAAWVCLMRTSAALLSSIRAEMKAAGLPPLEWYDVLWELERAPGDSRRPFDLEGRLLLAQYNLSRLIDRLSRAGYVSKRRCPVDGRGQDLAITDEGKALRARMWRVYSEAIERHLGSRLSEDEARDLCRLLLRLRSSETGAPKAGAERCG